MKNWLPAMYSASVFHLCLREKVFSYKSPLMMNWMSKRKGTSPPAGVLLLPAVVIEDSSVLRPGAVFRMTKFNEQ